MGKGTAINDRKSAQASRQSNISSSAIGARRATVAGVTASRPAVWDHFYFSRGTPGREPGANPKPVLLPRVPSGQQPLLNPTIPTAGHPQRFHPPRGRLPLSAMVLRRWRPRPAVRTDGDQCLPAPPVIPTSPVSPNVFSIHPESHNRGYPLPCCIPMPLFDRILNFP